jgi:hypothetical protein
MLSIACDRCGDRLTQPGALAFSPPQAGSWQVEKFHLCVSCWAYLGPELRRKRDSAVVGNAADDPQ